MGLRNDNENKTKEVQNYQKTTRNNPHKMHLRKELAIETKYRSTIQREIKAIKRSARKTLKRD